MASTQPTHHHNQSLKELKPTNPSKDIESQPNTNKEEEEDQENIIGLVVDYSKRAQVLRAAVLGANDGLLSTASLMMGVGAVREDAKIMILTGFAGLIAGACSMAIGEFVSVYSQYDIEVAQMKRERKETENGKKRLPNPFSAALASAVSFVVGALVPLLGACFVKDYKVRLGVIVGVVSLALLGFGALGAVLGKAAPLKSSLRVLFGGWLAMGITFGLTKAIGFASVQL